MALDPAALDRAMGIALAFGPGVLRAFHGSPNPIEGQFRPSERGRFGPGIYASEQPGVAAQYGKVNPVEVTENLFDASPQWRGSQFISETRNNMFEHLSPEEQGRVAEWWPAQAPEGKPSPVSSGEDIWEVMSRRLGQDRAQDVIKKLGYDGITGIGDGQEIAVFDPSNISLAKRRGGEVGYQSGGALPIMGIANSMQPGYQGPVGAPSPYPQPMSYQPAMSKASGGIVGYADGGDVTFEEAQRMPYLERRALPVEALTNAIVRHYNLGPTGIGHARQLAEDWRAFENAPQVEGPLVVPGYAAGGPMQPSGFGGIAQSTQTANPQQQEALQQYQNLPDEKLHELAFQFAGTPQGSAIGQVLAAREMNPMGSGYQPPSGSSMARGGFAEGGGAEDFGEAASMAGHMRHTTEGFIHSPVPGRTDLIHAAPAVGSFVIPADVVGIVGQGNSLAGAFLLQNALGKLPRGGSSAYGRIPAPPKPFTEPLQGPAAKRGGKTKGEEHIGKPTPILAAGGEYIVSPEAVRHFGGGDYRRGHDALDEWVVRTRKKGAKEMLRLPPPKT